MEQLLAPIGLFAMLVLVVLMRLIIKGTAGFLFEGIAQIARGLFRVIVWSVEGSLRLLWWLTIGWWWRRWVSPTF